MTNKLLNSKGRSSGLYLIIILIVALLVTWLSLKNLSSLDIGGSKPKGQEQVEQSDDPVQQANDVVDELNGRQQEALDAIEGEE